MSVPIVAGIGSQKSKYGNLSFPISAISGTSFNAYNTFNLNPPNFSVGADTLYETQSGGGGQPNLYNLTLTFDNTQLLANATLFENASLYPFNISISSGETPTTPPDKARFGGLLDPNVGGEPEAQLLAVLTTGLNKSVFLDLAGSFSVSIPFGEGSAGDWIMQGRGKVGAITGFGLGFLVNDSSRNPQNLSTEIQFVANLTNDLGIVCQSKATMYIKNGRIALEQPPPTQPTFNSLTFITITFGANLSTEANVSFGERLTSIANTGNGFILPVAAGSTGVAANYSSAANTQVNHEMVMNYNASSVDASEFPDLVQGRLVVQTNTANLGLYNRTDPGSYYSPSTNQVYTFTNLFPKEEVLAPEPSIDFSVLFEEDQAFRFVSGVNTTFTVQIEWQKNDGSYLSSIPQTITVNDNAVVPTMT
jgi:hypothetical protein